MIRVYTQTGKLKCSAFNRYFRFFRRGMTLGVMLTMSLYGCNDDNDNDEAAITTFQTTVVPQQTDQNFTTKASLANSAEIELGKLAAGKATSDSVRAYASSMFEEHSLAQEELKALAAGKSYPFYDAMDAEHLQLMNTLQNLQGSEFDKVYLESQIAGHQSTLTEFNTEIFAGNDPDVVSYANKYESYISNHLRRAVDIMNLLGDQTATAGITGSTTGSTMGTTGGNGTTIGQGGTTGVSY